MYDLLRDNGVDAGDYNDYYRAMDDASRRQKFYDLVTSSGIDLGGREYFEEAMTHPERPAPQEQPAPDPLEGYRKDAEAQKAAIDKFDADNAAFFREHEHRAKMLADYGGDLPVEQEAALHNAVNESLPVYESRKALRAQMQKDYDSSPYVRLQRLDPDGTAYGDMRRAERDIETYSEQLRAAGDDDEKKRVKGLLKAAREDYYRNPIVIGTNEENARSAEGANARVEEHMRELRESHKGGEARKPGFAEQFAKAMSGVAGDSMALQIAENYAGENEDRALAAAAESLNEDTAKIYRAPSKWGEESGWSNFWRGAAETASDIDFWTMGLSGMQDAMSLNGVFDKIRAKLGTEDLTEEKIDAALTPLEKDLYEAFCRNAMAQAERAEDMSKGYQAGASAADSLMFMAQFALTGGATEGAVKAMGKWLGKRLGVQALGKVGGLAAKGAGKVAQSAAMTLIQPTTYQGVLERVNRMEQSSPGDPSSPMRFADESGAVLKGLGDAWVENFSEMVGGPIDKVLSLPFKGAGKLARRMFGNTKFLDLAEAFYNSSAVEALKKGGWNNYAGEVGEELVGAAMRQTLGIDDQALSQFFDKDNMDIMLLSFLPTMGMGGVVNTARAGVAIRDYDKADTKYREASERLGIQPGSMENLKDAKTVGDVSAALTESIRAMMESGERVKAEDVMSAVDLAKAAVRRRFYEDAGKLQVNGRRERDFAGLGEKYGTFWSEGGDGGRTVTRVMWDGKPGFATATDETGLMSVTFDDGTKAMLRDGDLDISGGAPVKEVMPLDAFLDKVDESRRRKSEGERVQMESNANLLKAQERLQPQTVVNIGTLDSKVAGTVQQWTPDGVVIVTEDGMSREYPWEEAQRLPLYEEDTAPEVPQVKTDAQAEEEAVEALESADERKRHYNLWRTHDVTFRDGEKDVSGTLMMARTDDDTASVKMQVRLGDGTEQEIDESQIISVDGKTPGQVQEYGREYEDVWGREDEKAVPVRDGNAGEGDSGIGGPSSDAAVQSTGAAQERESASEPNLPLKADGSVDQKALWNSGPEAWAKWNDAARGDGGANSEAYLGAVLKQVEGEGKALAKAYAKETDFDKRDELEGRMLANAERSQKIGALLKGYADARAAAEEERKEQERKEKITARLEKERAALEANTPQTIEALAASMFSREDMRGKLDRDDFKRELGWGDTELRKFWPWWAKKGKGRSLISIAEAMPEFDDRGLIPVLGDAEQKDTQAARNAIISVFQQALSPKDVMSFTRRQNEETMERMRQEERDYVDGYFMQNYGMTADEYMASERAKDELEGTENQMPAHLAEHLDGVPDLLPTQDNDGFGTKQGNSEEQTPDAVSGDAGSRAEEIKQVRAIEEQRKVVDTEPTEAQKEAGNYRMGHVRIDGLDITIENPRGSIRKGTDAGGHEWQTEMHNDYGYIRGTKAVDDDHIDVFLSDSPTRGKVYVIDQVDPKTGEFDESKVMYGFDSEQDAREAYLSNYEDGWQGLGKITEVSKEEFKKWIDSSTRKTKPFSEYASVKAAEAKKENTTDNQGDPVNEDGTLKIDKIKSIDDLTDSDFSKPYRNVALPDLPENVNSAIGAEGKPVIIKKSIFEKVSKAHSFDADESRKILKDALYNPDIVGQSQPKSKKNNWIAIKIDDSSPIVVLEVNRNKDNVEIVGWYTLDNRNLERIRRQAEREDGELLILTPKGAAASLSTLPSDLSSADKSTQSSGAKQEEIEDMPDFEAEENLSDDSGDLPDFETEGAEEPSRGAADRARDGERVSPLEVAKAVAEENRPQFQTRPDDRKERQLEIINATNPMLDDYHTGIRKVGDIKTLSEAVEEAMVENGEDELSAYPDVPNGVFEEALKSGEITVYSSKPIRNGVFVTPSHMQAFDYAGYGKVYEKKVPIEDVAWINTDEGQYARAEDAGTEGAAGKYDAGQKDKEYFAALERGDMDTAQRIVNEAAERAGYAAGSGYQGTSAFNGAAPWGNGYFLTKEERKEAWDNDEFDGDQTLGDYIERGIDSMNLDFIALDPRNYRAADTERKEAIDNVRNAIQKKSKTITMYRSVPADVKEGSFRNGDWVTPSRAYAVENARIHGWGDNYNIIEQEVPVDEIWWDGNDIAEWGYGRESDYINDTDFAYKNTENNRKLLDVVTRDDNGEIIPPSKRFNASKQDERYQIAVKKKTDANSEASGLAFDAVSQMLSDAGIPVERMSDEAMRELAENANALETASVQNGHQPTVVSSASGAKVIKEIDNLIKELQNVSNYPKTILGDIAKALGAKKHGSNSQYATFEAKNGVIVTIRLANHNAATSTFDNHGEDNGISIVISARDNTGMNNDGRAHVTEYYYDAIRLRKAEGKPLAEIVKSIKQSLYSGEYKDTTGLAQVEEVNPENVPELMTGGRTPKQRWVDNYVNAVHLATGQDKKTIREGLAKKLEEARREAKELYADVLSGNFNDVTLQRIDNYIDNATDRNRFYRPLSQRLPERAVSAVSEGGRTGAVDALFSRICESTVPANERTRAEGRRKIEARKEECLEGWAKATGNWHESVADFTANTTPVDNGTDSDVYLSDDGGSVIKVSKGKFDNRKFPSDIDQVTLFNFVFPQSAYRILGYGRVDGKFVRFLEQPFVDFSESQPLTTEERVDYMGRLGFEPRNKEKTVFSNGEIVVSDLQKGNIVRSTVGNICVIEADVKIVDRIEFLKSGDTVYGAAVGGKILLNAEKLNPNTPVHEYTHLWDRACRTSNPELWRRGVELMKQTSVWKEVENDPNYSGLDEDGIASEVHSRLSGDNGEAVLTRMSQEIINEGGSPIDMAAKFSVISRLKKWLSDFWHWVKDTMTPWSREEAEKVSLEDFVNMPLSDLAKGTRISLDETGGASYSIVTDANEIDRLDSEPKIKAYRAMQLVDGKLYPPMSGKVNGKWRDGIAVEDLGKVWEKADENPELADDRGLFTLNKGNGTSLKARYNPYIHTSTTPLNDQFSSAQSRPELVTVEVEVPESELTSGYRAEKAKDSVGKVEWKAGAVQGKLSGTRTVILSRWDKPVRIVPDPEVADKIVEMFDGRDITMPSNVVTPSLRAELERRGVSFVETDNQGRRVEGDGIRYRQGAFISGLESEDEVYDAFDELMETRHPLQLQSALEDYYGGAIRSASWGAKNAMQNEGLLPFPGDKYSGAEGEHHHIMFEGEDGNTFVKDVPFDTVENVEARLPEKTEVSTARFRNGATSFTPGEIARMETPILESKGTFQDLNEAEKWAKEHLQGKSYTNTFTGEDVHIGSKSLSEVFDKKFVKAISPDLHKAAVMSIPDFIRSGIPAEVHPDTHGRGFDVVRLYSAILIDDNIYRVKSTVRRVQQGDRYYSYELQEMELAERRPLAGEGEEMNSHNPNDSESSITSKNTDGTQSPVVGVDGTDISRSQTRAISGEELLRGVKKTNSDEEILWNRFASDSEPFSTAQSDAPSAANIVKDFENPTPSDADRRRREATESARYNASDYRRSVSSRRLAAEKTANGLGVKVSYVSRAEMPENGRHAAGYWKDGQIYVCLENNIDAEDAVKTVLHEAVGHNGLRRLVGSGNMTAFCHEMFGKLPKVEREAIARDAVRNGGNLSEAVEEHLARIAETLNPDKSYERNLWDIIRDGVRRMLAKIGIDIPLSQRDLRWLLWQSAQANRLRDPLVQARRQAMANRLGFSRMAREISGEAEDAMRFRKADEAFDADAASLYNHQVMTARERLKEVWVDQFASVETLVDAIEEKSGKKARGFEDVRLALNQQSSKGLAAMQKWEREHWNPIGESVKKIIADTGMRLEDIERYVMLKHGLERNEVFAKRDARKHYQAMHDSEVDKIRSGGWAKDVKDAAIARADAALELRLSQIEAGTDSEYLKNRETDYGGLTGMYSEFDEIAPFDPVMETEEQFLARQKRARHPKYDNVGEMERAATAEVADFETKAGESVDMLWKAVNAATKATLRHQYESNMLSRKQYEDVKGMFRYYVPLRGFKDAEASDIYNYYQSDQRNGFSAPLVHAKGRTTEAESPFGNIGAVASSAIAQDAKNDAKLAFYYFVSNRPDNGLVTISDVWYEKQYDADGNPVTDEAGRAVFKPAYPEFRDDLSAESSKEEFRKFEHEMEDKAKRGDAFKGERKLSLDYVVHIDPAQEKAHVVRVKVGGKEKMMLINGNPRASQAMNGEFNMERSDGFKNLLQKWLRYISGMNTSYNPEFWISNFQRDVLFSLMSASVKEDPEYFRLFRKNLVEARKVVAMNRALQDGTLGDSATEKAYREFVDNGGVTGYTVLKKAEEWDLALKKLTGDELAAVNGVKTAFEAVQQFGESIEQMTRFAAFLTSRQQGKGIRESVSDAKELTVNFNRKGSGQAVTWKETARLRTDSGRPLNDVQRALVMGASWLSAYGRLYIMFFNAAVQGVNALYRLFRKDAKRMMMWASGYAAIGAMYAALHAMLDDDDDYLDIPDYERRNNLLIGGKGVYFKWALPQEARVFYALGDVAVNRILGREPHKAGVKGFATEIGSMIGDVLPMNFMEGERGFVPSFTIPIVESLINKDYKGSKIYNDMRYLSDEERKRTPAYQKAYRDTGKVLIDVSAALNGLTGGDYADAGWVNLNPAVIEHLIEGYTGGAGTTVEKIFKSTVGRAVGGEFSVRSTPFLSRLLTINDERYRNAHTTDLFNYYKAEAEHTRKRLRTYSRNGDDKRLDALYDSKDYEIMLIYRQYKGLMEYYADQLKLTDDKAERKRLMREQDEYRKQMIREISEIR